MGKIKQKEVLAATSKGGLSLTYKEGKTYFLPRADIPFEDLTPDPKNPRYRYLVEGKDNGLSPDDMYDRLIQDEATLNLARSINGVGGLTDPILVEKQPDGKYLIREGMRRWAAYRNLRASQESKGQPVTWKTMAAHVVPKDMDRKAIMIYIGTVHYQGKLHWDGHARAGYIHELRTEFKMTTEDISEVVGISKQEVERSLLAYDHSTKHAKQKEQQSKGQSSGGKKVEPKYSAFYELLTQKGATSAIKDKEIREAIYDGIDKVENSKQARDIAKIVQNDKARKVLQEGEGVEAYRDAMAVLQTEDPAAVGVFRIIKKAATDLESGYGDALKHLQRQRGNKNHLAIFGELVEIVVRLARDSGRTAVIEKALKQRQGRNGSAN